MDAPLASNEFHSSQIYFLVILRGVTNKSHILKFASKKSRYIVHSIMGGELYACTDVFDAGFSIISDIRVTLGSDAPLRFSTDSKQVFDVVTRGKRPTERRPGIEGTTGRDTYECQEIMQVGFIRGVDNHAYSLAKQSGNKALKVILETGVDVTLVQEWIVRKDGDTRAI